MRKLVFFVFACTKPNPESACGNERICAHRSYGRFSTRQRTLHTAHSNRKNDREINRWWWWWREEEIAHTPAWNEKRKEKKELPRNLDWFIVRRVCKCMRMWVRRKENRNESRLVRPKSQSPRLNYIIDWSCPCVQPFCISLLRASCLQYSRKNLRLFLH